MTRCRLRVDARRAEGLPFPCDSLRQAANTSHLPDTRQAKSGLLWPDLLCEVLLVCGALALIPTVMSTQGLPKTILQNSQTEPWIL